MIIICPPEKPLWMTCHNIEFIKWYKKTFPKQYEKERVEWMTPKERAKYDVDKIFEELRQAGE
jgi:hypothetical protein